MEVSLIATQKNSCSGNLFKNFRTYGSAQCAVRTAPQGSPRTPAKCIAATTPGLIIRITITITITTGCSILN